MNSPPQRPPPAPRVPIPWWQWVIIGFTGMLLLGICTIVVAPEPPPDSKSPEPASPTTEPPPEPTPTPLRTMDTYTGLELYECVTNTSTSIPDRVRCEDMIELSQVHAYLQLDVAEGEFSTVEQRELERVLEIADGTLNEVEWYVRNPYNMREFCLTTIPDWLTITQTLTDYQTTLDENLLYLDYKTTTLSEILRGLGEACLADLT